jgi:hypothetical protein
MRTAHLAVECPKCREWMSLADFNLSWAEDLGLTVEGEIECPVPECGLVFRVEGGEAIYQCREGLST